MRALCDMKVISILVLSLLLGGCIFPGDTITTTKIEREVVAGKRFDIDEILNRISSEDNGISLKVELGKNFGVPKVNTVYECIHDGEMYYIAVEQAQNIYNFHFSISGFGVPPKEREQRLLESMNYVYSIIENEIEAR